MDWFSWLSKSGLDSSLIYEYGLAFSRNELQAEDLAYFNHEFLQSMGISVAKHRLEILKLAKKEIKAGPNSLSKLVLAINKTKKCVTKYFTKWGSHEEAVIAAVPVTEPARYRDQWRGALTRKYKSDKDFKVELPMIKTRNVAKSGPLDGRMLQEKLMVTNGNLKLSGPLDRKVQDRLVFSYKSPKLSGPLDGRVNGNGMYCTRSPLSEPMEFAKYPSPKLHSDSKDKLIGNGDYDDHSLWAALFLDMKPT
ncbi:SAM_2 domain-containing protein [Cephalotus follicularis]|uniref:SAM_2 domain-containing protein n=1 Tax=Cephalotus follicularis TaxID=3775 RepID=A0A1Q3CPL5_CEPFO|nr:SAM_2 domain-containing protein [Cephalotus follicularis]